MSLKGNTKTPCALIAVLHSQSVTASPIDYIVNSQTMGVSCPYCNVLYQLVLYHDILLECVLNMCVAYAFVSSHSAMYSVLAKTLDLSRLTKHIKRSPGRIPFCIFIYTFLYHSIYTNLKASSIGGKRRYRLGAKQGLWEDI